MKSLHLAFLALAAFASLTIQGQLFHPLGLGIETPSEMLRVFQPQIHVEGDTLFACTKQGLYSKDLSKEGSEWQLAGFEGIPVLDFVRRGNDIYALCFNGPNDIFLLSHDGGRTYEDATPDDFRYFTNREGHVFWYFSQHPTDPNTFLLSSYMSAGTFLSNDFGKTWEKLSSYTPDYMGFHPLTPDVIYECGGGGFTDEKADFRISYDGGQTWEDKSGCLPQYCVVHRMAFHPTDPDRWIAGGYRQVLTTNDNGRTWNFQMFYHNDEKVIDWCYAAFDNDNPDIVYLAGGHQTQYMKLMCSTDGGTTWNKPYLEPIKTTPTEYMFDMKQYGDKLLIYSQSDVYEVAKAELIELTTPVTFSAGQMATIILPTAPDAGNGKYYRLDRMEGNEIIFEQELQPRAHVPYIVVPGEDFSIELGAQEVEGLTGDTVSVEGVSFIGTYHREEINPKEGFSVRIIDTTPDCSHLPVEEQGVSLFVGALRAYLLVHWDDPYNPGGTKAPTDKMEIVLRDTPNSLQMVNDKSSNGKCFDLQGRRLSGKPAQGLYIEEGQKKLRLIR